VHIVRPQDLRRPPRSAAGHTQHQSRTASRERPACGPRQSEQDRWRSGRSRRAYTVSTERGEQGKAALVPAGALRRHNASLCAAHSPGGPNEPGTLWTWALLQRVDPAAARAPAGGPEPRGSRPARAPRPACGRTARPRGLPGTRRRCPRTRSARHAPRSPPPPAGTAARAGPPVLLSSSHSIWLASRRRGRRRDGRAPRLSAAQACMDVRGLQGVVQRRCRLSLSGLTTVRQASEPSRALTSRRRGRGPGGAPVSCRRRSRQPAPCAGPRAGRPSAAHPGCAPAAAHLHACRTLKPVRALDAGVTARGAGAASLSVCA